MTVVDVIVVVVLMVALLVGVRRGLCENLAIVLGVIAGGLAAYGFVPLVAPRLPGGEWRGVAAAGLVVALLVVGTALGGFVGHLARAGVDRTPLRGVERLLGGFATVLIAGLVLSFTASSVTLSATSGVSAAVGSSRVLRAIEDVTPAPLQESMAQLRASLLVDGLPPFGALIGAGTAVDVAPPLDTGDVDLQQASASVARVSGTALSCGRTITGSGFAVTADRIVTNAHVVAGVESPLVELPGGTPVAGRVVYFDPTVDLAVIAVDGLGATPLAISGDIEAGAAAAVQGYPLGGPLTTVEAQVLSRSLLQVPDIYGGPSAPRDVYALATDVRPGNSGGPLLTGDGTVAGVVFARGEDDAQRGYAVTDALLEPVAAGAAGYVDTVDTGACAR